MSETLALPLPDAQEGSGDPWIDAQFAALTEGLEDPTTETPFGMDIMRTEEFRPEPITAGKHSTGTNQQIQWTAKDNGQPRVDHWWWGDAD